jgi:hypothetical protein
MKSRIYQEVLIRNLKLKLLGSNKSVKRYQMKTTSNWRRPPTEEDLKISQQQLVGSYSKLKHELFGSNQSVQMYQMMTNSYGRWPQNMKSRIYQQPPVGSYSNLKLELLGSNQSAQMYQMKTTSNGRWPPMEDDLKIWKVEYLNNHWLDLTQILNLSYWDQTKVTKVSNENQLYFRTSL